MDELKIVFIKLSDDLYMLKEQSLWLNGIYLNHNIHLWENKNKTFSSVDSVEKIIKQSKTIYTVNGKKYDSKEFLEKCNEYRIENDDGGVEWMYLGAKQDYLDFMSNVTSENFIETTEVIPVPFEIIEIQNLSSDELTYCEPMWHYDMNKVNMVLFNRNNFCVHYFKSLMEKHNIPLVNEYSKIGYFIPTHSGIRFAKIDGAYVIGDGELQRDLSPGIISVDQMKKTVAHLKKLIDDELAAKYFSKKIVLTELFLSNVIQFISKIYIDVKQLKVHSKDSNDKDLILSKLSKMKEKLIEQSNKEVK